MADWRARQVKMNRADSTRTTGNHDFLLRIHAAHSLLASSRLWCRAARLRRLSILCSGASRPFILDMYLPDDQRIRRLPALRRRDDAFGLVATHLLDHDVHHQLRGLNPDVQRRCGPRADEHCWVVCGGLSFQRAVPIRVRRHAGHPRGRHAAGTVAVGAYFLWGLVLRRRAGAALHFEPTALRCDPALYGRPLLRHGVQFAGRHDGIQGALDRTGVFVTQKTNALQYWDSITREDLEFSVGARQNNWEFKELLPQDDPSAPGYADSEYASSMYHQPRQRNSMMGY